MGFRREPIMVFEDLMNQHLFGNRHILNPITNQPWDRPHSPFACITPFQMTKVADLYYSFDQVKHKRDPEVRAVRSPDLALANLVFTTHHNRPQIHLRQWNQLYLSITPTWRVIIQSGNQEFNEGEVLATVLEGGDIGDIYRSPARPRRMANAFRINTIYILVVQNCQTDPQFSKTKLKN